jgi:hypothetical protein
VEKAAAAAAEKTSKFFSEASKKFSNWVKDDKPVAGDDV